MLFNSTLLRSQPTVSHTLYHHIQRGYISIKPNLERMGAGRVVKFVDGSVGNYDAIVFATGAQLLDHFLRKIGSFAKLLSCV